MPTVKGQKPRSFNRDLRKSVITIKVGPEDAQETFVVHKELIRHYSEFFRAATTGEWEEAKTGVMKCPEDRVEEFAVFEEWLYTQTLDLGEQQVSLCPLDHLKFLVNLFVLGDKLGAPIFQNAIIDVLHREIYIYIEIEDPNRIKAIVHHVYEVIAKSSPLRKLLVRRIASGAGSIQEYDVHGLPVEFLSGLIRAMHYNVDNAPAKEYYLSAGSNGGIKYGEKLTSQ